MLLANVQTKAGLLPDLSLNEFSFEAPNRVRQQHQLFGDLPRIGKETKKPANLLKAITLV